MRSASSIASFRKSVYLCRLARLACYMETGPWTSTSCLLRAAGGDDFDQGHRRRAFEAQHPEAFIGMIASGTWQARIREENGETVVTRWFLRDLMDELEKRYPPADESAPAS